MYIIFLGPHFDDCILSCGELIDKYIKEGNDVQAITFFTGFPDSEKLSSAAKEFHSNCFLDDQSMLYRADEDVNALSKLGCNYRHLGFYECLYRQDTNGQYLYPDLKNIYHLEKTESKELFDKMLSEVKKIIEKSDIIFAPLGLGNHADHLLLHNVVKEAEKYTDKKIYYYEEVPYVCYYYKKRKTSNWGNGMTSKLIYVSNENWTTKVDTIKFYRSQLHILWKNELQRIQQLSDLSYKYDKSNHSIRIWSYIK